MRVAVNGASLWIEQDGDGPVVMVPTGGGVEFYRRTLSTQFRTRHRVVFVEMRGTGGSSGSVDGLTFADLAGDVEAVRVAMGLGPVAVLGQSNHGCIALEHGLRHPDGNVAVVSVASVLDGRDALKIGLERWGAEASDELKADLDRRMKAHAADTSPISDDERGLRQYLAYGALTWRDPDAAPAYWGGVPFGAGTYLPWIGAAIPGFDASERIRELRSPLLAVCGRYDYVCPVESWAAIGNAPNGRLEIFEHSAHNPQVEEQQRFDEIVGEFLQKAVL
jgi:proline iminopeptidase